jgi:phage baseplate assembly protein gpV
MNRTFFGKIARRAVARSHRRIPGLEPLESRDLLSVVGLPANPHSHAALAPGIVSNPAHSATTPDAQPAPTLVAVSATSSAIDLLWSAVDGATSYELQGRLAGTTDWYPNNGTSGQITTSALTYQNTGLASGTAYEYRVRAVTDAGNTEYSSIATARTRTIPTLMALPVSSDAINLSWSAIDGATGYELQGRLAGTFGWYPDNGTSGQITTTGLTYQNTGLASGTTYEYRVRAVTDGGNTEYSPIATATTISGTQTTLTLTAFSVAPTLMNLSWTAVTGATSYVLQGRLAGTTDWYPNNGTSGQVTISGLFYQNTGLAPGTTYEYRVLALDDAGNPLTDWSATASATTHATFG